MGGNKMWVPTSHWGMGALTLYCMHFGVSSRGCIWRAVTTPYWGMESLTSHGKVLGSLLSTLCAESVSVGVVARREVSSLRLAEPYIGLSWPRLSLFPPLCPHFHPLVCLDFPSVINRFSDEGLSSGTEGCQKCEGAVKFCHFLFVFLIINSLIPPISLFL
jgi:hypothetical protein